ncbi:hypothetical protein [Saccharothrix luteola]|uniref:hypothetical protein n=1 Tax=Saccharothrix luteola TaxID=2893018 RepID=UPI001E2F8497|nr:hypothetical protein [Saccharothrix luteola]MCC8247029.1 hypothetical protein [Saccharothrix luteola]
MSTPIETKNDFVDENVETVENVHQGGTTTPVTPETGQDQHGHNGHDHEHTYENGELSPRCVSGGCVTKAPTR